MSFKTLIDKKEITDLSPYVPYTGATQDVDLGTHKLTTLGQIKGGQLYADGGGVYSYAKTLSRPDMFSGIGYTTGSFKVDNDGNLETSGTITGTDIYGTWLRSDNWIESYDDDLADYWAGFGYVEDDGYGTSQAYLGLQNFGGDSIFEMYKTGISYYIRLKNSDSKLYIGEVGTPDAIVIDNTGDVTLGYNLTASGTSKATEFHLGTNATITFNSVDNSIDFTIL